MPDSPMPIPEIEALKELARNWRKSPYADYIGSEYATQLESLIPQVEKAVAALESDHALVSAKVTEQIARACRAETELAARIAELRALRGSK